MNVNITTNFDEERAGGGASYVSALASALSERAQVTLQAKKMLNKNLLEEWYGWNLKKVTCKQRSRKSSLVVEVKKRMMSSSTVQVVQATHIPRLPEGRIFLLCEFPFQKNLSFRDKIRLKCVEKIITNSLFSASWIQKRWGVQAEVIYPPVKLIPLKKKKKMILAVGRFVSGKRDKKQKELIRLFKEMDTSEWELHLAGIVEDEAYFEQCKRQAKRSKIIFHPNCTNEALEQLFQDATLFWHAVGANVEEENYPEHMEHFGMVTAKAMAAQCIPVVINKGGQKEMVEEEALLWDTYEECLQKTMDLISDEKKQAVYREIIKEKALRFSFETFKKKVEEVVV